MSVTSVIKKYLYVHTYAQVQSVFVNFLKVLFEISLIFFISDTPRFRGMVSELDCWMEWIENQMAEEMYDVPTEDDMDDFVGGRL